MNARDAFATDLIGVRLDADGQDRLELVVEEMQCANPELTVDDCIDAIFSIGLISAFSTLTVMEALKEASQCAST